MTANGKSMPHDLHDDAPDLSTAEWRGKFDKAKLRRGRPQTASPKISTTIRLSPEVLVHVKKGGPGWQTRIDEALRKIADNG